MSRTKCHENEDEDLAVSIRRAVNEAVAKEPEAFDRRDIEGLLAKEDFIYRIVDISLGVKDIVDHVTKIIVTCFKWRKEGKINDFDGSQLAEEIMSSGRFRIGRDVQGRRYFFERAGLHKKLSLVAFELHMKVMGCLFEQVYKEGEEAVFYFDIGGAGFNVMDMNLGKRYVELFTKHYPGICSKAYVFGMSTAVSAFIRTVMKLVPQRCSDKAAFVSSPEALALMGSIEDFPISVINGKKCVPLEELCRDSGLSDQEKAAAKTYWDWVREECLKRSHQANGSC